ncbi:MAG: MotA/TolQ/ExbB proton channel family protein [Bdellovibrionales bacterium]
MTTAVAAKPMFIVSAFEGGGIFMFFILAFFLLTIGLILERTSFFSFGVKSAPKDFRKSLLANILRGEYRNAETYAKSFAATSIGKIAAIGCALRANGAGDEEIQARMDEKLASEISRVDRRTGFLAMYGNVSTLLGLLGTIVGMIHSFAAVASANPADRAMMLSKGISEAMNCTAFGLITAIPALVAFAYFQNKTDKLVGGITEQTTEIYHDLVFLSEGESALKRNLKGPAARASVISEPMLEA